MPDRSIRRLLVLPAVGVICAAEIWRRGFAAPLLYGARLHIATLNPRHRDPPPTYEPDIVA